MTQPRCALGRLLPNSIDVEKEKADGWNDHRILVVRVNDDRLSWIEQQIVAQIGAKLYGERARQR